jgi:nitroimidazol reductase NimA-like FMN-containing flavoprotein (pyridoxamine 5'-phosphate oxidase superfamily)
MTYLKSIKNINSYMEEDKLERDIEEYLKTHNICTIAVSDSNMPSAHTVYYISHRFHIYFASAPDSQKIHILRSNPRISLTVDEDCQNWRKIRGIQLFGRALLTDERKSPALQEAFLEKFPHISDVGGIPPHHVFVEVIPEKIYYMDFSHQFGSKKVLYIDEKKSILSW